MALKGFKGYRKAKLNRTVHNKEQGYSFDALLNIYIYAKRVENVSEHTIDNKKSAVKLLTEYIKRKGLDVKPETLTAEHCRQFNHYLRFEHVKHANNRYKKDKFKTVGLVEQTVNTHLRHLKAFYNFFSCRRLFKE